MKLLGALAVAGGLLGYVQSLLLFSIISPPDRFAPAAHNHRFHISVGLIIMILTTALVSIVAEQRIPSTWAEAEPIYGDSLVLNGVVTVLLFIIAGWRN